MTHLVSWISYGYKIDHLAKGRLKPRLNLIINSIAALFCWSWQGDRTISAPPAKTVVLAMWSNLYPRTVLKSVPEDQILTAKSMLDILCWKNYKKKSWPSYQTLTGWKDRMKVSLSACHTIGRNNVQEPLQDGGPVYKIGRPLRGCVISADLAGTKKRPP